MSRVHRIRSAVAVIVIAGTAPALLAQNDPASQPGHDPVRDDRTGNLDRGRDRDRDDARLMMDNGVDFRSGTWIDDRDVVNTDGQRIGEIKDFIINRGSGQIEHAVVRTGAILGMGGKDVLVPYQDFQWDPRLKKLRLNITKDQLRDHPEYSHEEWKRAMGTDEQRSAIRDRLNRDPAADPYEGRLRDARATQLEGEIIAVDRERTGDAGEQIVLTLRGQDGENRRVILGPSWYVSSGRMAPMRGQHVKIEGVEPPGGDLIVARRIEIDGRELSLRSDDNTPAWVRADDGRAADKPDDDKAPDHSRASGRYLLMSSLVGADVDCRGVACGTVDDIVLERNSGNIAFLSIDPDRNFLGMGDTKRLVPWQVATVYVDGDVHLDANREMVLASPQTPDDLSTLNRAEMVYQAYGVQPPEFRPVARAAGPWGPVYASMDRATSTTLTGTVQDISTRRLSDDLKDARTIAIRTADGVETVLLGPSAQDRQIPAATNDRVVVEAFRANINGKPYWVAHTITSNGQRVTLLERGGGAWDPDR